MIKKIAFLLFLVSAFMLTSCMVNGGRVLISNEDKIADARMEQILSAIKDKESEELKALFSQKALDEAKDFDDGMDYLFEFIQGDVTSWERDMWSSDEKIRSGKRTVMLRSWYIVNTDKNEYLFFIIDFDKDTVDPSNEGLYTVRVIKAEDEETQFTYWQDMEIPGIYKPKEEQNEAGGIYTT